ncbi:MarR family transcriptional regulator, partial [Streptomyces werraensis]
MRRSRPECPTGLQSFAVQLRRMTGEFNRIVQEFAQAHG